MKGRERCSLRSPRGGTLKRVIGEGKIDIDQNIICMYCSQIDR